ncbi:ATP-binding protein [Roseateles chitosanitabidus]|uniref:ATP-binding protein n=1 Tax=Roseateles chitosanitabidus TaxID=65048 RepID=UPI000832F8C6|nr:ATP-binding protein [Roseateles chitosanitabidus]MBO9686729.1 ATP-binding protein [Roseateles chitosanitabidus]
MEIFHRTSLAEELATFVLDDRLAPASSGLFLSARRRTGKSTFLRYDLEPELLRRDAIVIYADLWKERAKDPALVITQAIRAELERHDGVVVRLARLSGLERVAVGGLAFSMDRVGLGGDVFLADALAALSDETRRMIVLIIDEAHHAQATPQGIDVMYALKAARDQLNMGPHHGLRIVATGSSRDKLAVLVDWKDQAFFCAPMQEFPPLGVDYLDWICGLAPASAALTVDGLAPIFERAGHRPEWMHAGLMALERRKDWTPGHAHEVFAQVVEARARARVHNLLGQVGLLSPLESAVLRVMAAQGQNFVPFWTRTMETYRMVIEVDDGNASAEAIDLASVRQALETLKDKGFLWRSVHGSYALEEFGIKEALEEGGLLTESTRRVTRMGRQPALSAGAIE